MDEVRNKTINDYGDQFSLFGLEYAGGRHGTTESLSDLLGPLINMNDINQKRVVDIGSGAGRVVNILLAAGANHVHSVEPSHAFDLLVNNTKPNGRDRVSYFHGCGDEYTEQNFDTAFTLGVLHHIPDPNSTVRHIYQSLKPGGVFYAWLYGKENNRLVLSIMEPIRAITQLLPDRIVLFLSYIAASLLSIYAMVCKLIPLPLRRYMRDVFLSYSFRHRALVLFDLLNPAYARYYTQNEARQLFLDHGFTKVELYHRAESSWGVKASK